MSAMDRLDQVELKDGSGMYSRGGRQMLGF